VSSRDQKAGTFWRQLVLTNQYGLHARPAALFAKIAMRYDADVSVEKGGTVVSGKSIMGLMTLQAAAGSTLKVTATGADAEQALAELTKLVDKGFGED
jgi:phosphocarrier protein